MLSFQWLLWIFLLLAPQRGKSALMPLPSACVPFSAQFSSAIDEVIDMANNALTRTRVVNNAQRLDADMMVTLQTANTYFSLLSEGIENRIATLQVILNRVINLRNDGKGITIWCDQVYLEDNPQTNSPSRYIIRDSNGQTILWPPGNVAICYDAGPVSVTVPGVDWITICPNTFNSLEFLVGDSKNYDYKGHPIDEMLTISYLLFRSFILVLFDGDFALVFNQDSKSFSDCYAYRNQNPATSIRNPDCVALYVLSLYFENNDWSTGTAR